MRFAGVTVYPSIPKSDPPPHPRLIPDRLKGQLREERGLSVLWKVSVGEWPALPWNLSPGQRKEGKGQVSKAAVLHIKHTNLSRGNCCSQFLS